MLPLDLHVLSLPLAFILSQDQTLHCKIYIVYLKLSVYILQISQLSIIIDSRYVLYVVVLHLFNELFYKSALKNLKFLGEKRVQR
jgi:hypothetical protein